MQSAKDRLGADARNCSDGSRISEWTISSVGPFGPGLRRVPTDENRRRYFLSTSALWNHSNQGYQSERKSIGRGQGRGAHAWPG